MSKELRFKIISEGLKDGVSITCRKYNISRTLFYRWLERYKSNGVDGLADIQKDFTPANKTDTKTEAALLSLIKEYPHYGPRALKYLFDELEYKLSESAIYNIMKRNNLTQKELRIEFAKNQDNRVIQAIPSLDKLNNGECWLFWIIDYGHYKYAQNIYEYTFYDLKSKIACTRLYKEVSLENFENLLAAVAMPVAQTLHLNINYLCFFKNDKIIKQLGRTFKSKINKTIINHGFEFNAHILSDENKDYSMIEEFKNKYTKGCLSFLMPLMSKETTFDELKIEFQSYIKHYNLTNKTMFGDESYSPVEYHTKVTNTKLILPMWAYLGRRY